METGQPKRKRYSQPTIYNAKRAKHRYTAVPAEQIERNVLTALQARSRLSYTHSLARSAARAPTQPHALAQVHLSGQKLA